MELPDSIAYEAAKFVEMKRNPNSILVEVEDAYDELVKHTAAFIQDRWLNEYLDGKAPNPSLFDLLIVCAADAVDLVDELVSDEEEDDEEPIQLTDHDKELFLKAMRKVNGGKNEDI